MEKTCAHCSKKFVIDDSDRAFYTKIHVPAPTLCALCRMQRRLAWRNERNLYHDTCGLCGKKIISMYAPGHPFPVYCQTCWWSDAWDPQEHGQEYSPSKSFFAQYHALLQRVPRLNLATVNTENSDYCNYVGFAHNSYLCFGSIHIEDCMYGSPYESRDCYDSFLVRESELCYECIDCEKCYACQYCQDCSTSSDLIACFDCKGSQNCIASIGLRNKKYYIFNKAYSQQEYENIKTDLKLNTRKGIDELLKKFAKFKLNFPHKYAQNLNNENVSGNYIVNSKNARDCFDVKKAQDVRYCAQIIDAKDSYDVNYCEHFELCYEHIGYYGNNNIQFCNTCGECADCQYSDFCKSSQNLFGCVGLRNKKYCILNKQYTKQEYETLRAKIIADMHADKTYGEFPPMGLSPFSYQDSVAADYFPQQIKTKITQHTLPQEAGRCIVCAKAYKILPKELNFYKKQDIPLPQKCPECRHSARFAQRTPRLLWKRQCAKCNMPIQSAYAPDRPEIIHCEQCYLQS
ncbi:hypothetical protein COV82_00710 [Candidatus Peregrinibacteria bacterium CG11_big_fil_rev_8_21_14_0_20_46_8]|nr:MAG: hypothetical protein COV82_00710 [Candidatus Peregrinibacteria bacterium CG11_big_fil_rev_8_21_14_0_20_46_8]